MHHNRYKWVFSYSLTTKGTLSTAAGPYCISLTSGATNAPQFSIVFIKTLLTIAYFFPIRIASNQLITEVANECLTVYAISPIENDNNNSYHLY